MVHLVSLFVNLRRVSLLSCYHLLLTSFVPTYLWLPLAVLTCLSMPASGPLQLSSPGILMTSSLTSYRSFLKYHFPRSLSFRPYLNKYTPCPALGFIMKHLQYTRHRTSMLLHLSIICVHSDKSSPWRLTLCFIRVILSAQYGVCHLADTGWMEGWMGGWIYWPLLGDICVHFPQPSHPQSPNHTSSYKALLWLPFYA